MRKNQGWLVLVAVFSSSALAIGSSQYAFGVFVEPLEQEFGWTRTQINASLSFAALSSLVSPLVGRIMDRIGARPVMCVSLFLMALSYVLRAFMTELWHWYGVSALQYLAFPGSALLPAGRLVAMWFPQTRGRMMGVALMGANFGGFTMPSLAALVVGLLSWQAGYNVFALLSVAVGLFAVLSVREVQTEASDKTSDTVTNLPGVTLRMAMASGAFYRVTLGVVLATFTYSAVLPQIIPHLVNEGLTTGNASVLLSITAIFGMGGKVLFGYLSERITARSALMVNLFGQTIGVCLFVLSGASLFRWVTLPSFGLFFGGLGALMPIMIQDTFGIRDFGSIYGMVNMATVVSFFCGPLLAGLVFDATGSYQPAFLLIAVFYIVGAFVLGTIKPIILPESQLSTTINQ